MDTRRKRVTFFTGVSSLLWLMVMCSCRHIHLSPQKVQNMNFSAPLKEFINPSVCLFTRLDTCRSFHLFIHPFTNSSIHFPTHPPNNSSFLPSFIAPFHPSLHPSIHPSIHPSFLPFSLPSSCFLHYTPRTAAHSPPRVQTISRYLIQYHYH